MIPTIREIADSERIAYSAASRIHYRIRGIINKIGIRAYLLPIEEIERILFTGPDAPKYSNLHSKNSALALTRRAVAVLQATIPPMPTVDEIVERERVPRVRATRLRNSAIKAWVACGDEILSLTPDEVANVVHPYQPDGRRDCGPNALSHFRRAVRILQEAQT